MINWFKKDKRVVVRDTNRPFWYKRFNSIKEAKEYIDSVRGHSSMSAIGDNFYASYSIYNEWVVVDRSAKEIVN